MNLKDELRDRKKPSDPELDNNQIEPEEPPDSPEEDGSAGDSYIDPADPPDSDGDSYIDP